MIFNVTIGVLIFGYAGWALYRSIKKSRQGKCAACELSKVCKTNCTTMEPREPK
ncbi:FeoB-associated Cys-rich membrane protein [Neobacillus sp. PS3-12]|jgi:radical SAM protein with 4Fe4S-binding SPASM domain|uniref:FeoB-associated Cys-rich membrane protein n=1 Tax=Neobacillus sp. PS3-12 TaxID=3070677 RepID=UPI0027DFE446|nr:FeoB-associated Cys-rich membrane protein [Neobacillus sp. PS3-12]WML55217.1 FeoB-associated Cys-rich membrane protein [Neobacillus sp. PS3-12]